VARQLIAASAGGNSGLRSESEALPQGMEA